jgi:Glyoxalase/Bleomycin resistance protein/Dioxygenase superfamily
VTGHGTNDRRSRSQFAYTCRMRALAAVLVASLSVTAVSAQAPAPAAQSLGVRPPQFLAISVADLDASTKWYTQSFALSTTRDLPSTDGSVRTRILSSPEFVIELSQHASAKPLRDYAGAPTPTFLVHGFFKAGVFVDDLDRAVAQLTARGVKGIGAAQADESLGLRWVLFRDNGGNFLQLLERRPALKK